VKGSKIDDYGGVYKKRKGLGNEDPESGPGAGSGG